MDGVAVDPSPSLDGAMDSFFADTAAPAASAPPPDPGTGADPGAPPAPGDAAPPAEGADVDAAADPNAPPPPAQPAAPPANAPDLPEGATLDGKAIRIDVPRFNNIYKDYKFAQEVRNIIPDIQTAQAFRQRAVDFREMHADFTSGNVNDFLDYWERESPDGFSALTQRAFERAPEAVRSQLTQQAITGYFDSLYAKAAESGDAHDLYKARMTEYWATGQYRKDMAPKVDPLAAREKAIADRENALKQQDQQRAEQTWNNWSKATYNEIGGQLNAKIDAMLQPIKAKYEDAPELFQALRSTIRQQAIQAVEGDQEWLRSFRLDFKSARNTMSPGDRQALVQQYLAAVDRHLVGKAAPLIKQAGARLVQTNQAEHERLAAGSARRGAAAPGAPVRTSVSNGQRDRGTMSLDEKIDMDMALS
jgi:hypothetical protein